MTTATGPALAYVDTETTGLDERPGWRPRPGSTAEPNTVWEVAVVRRGPHHPSTITPGTWFGTWLGQWAWQLRVDPALVNPAAAQVNGFHERYLMDRAEHRGAEVIVTAAPPGAAGLAPGDRFTWESWARLFVMLVDGCGWVGIVPDFDVAHLVPRLTRAGQLAGWPFRPWHYHLIDPEVTAAGLLGLDPPYDSDAIAAAFGIKVDPQQRHTALGDALHAQRLHMAVLAAARAPGLARARTATLADLALDPP